VGQIDVLAGVFIRTGSVIASSGVRVVSGLVQRLGLLSFISDNAGCLDGQPFPRNGRIMSFGSHEVYVGTERVCRYPKQVQVAADPPSHLLAHAGRSARPVESAEVMMAGTTMPPADGAGKAAAADTPPEPPKAKRSARPLLERVENLASTSGVPGQVLLPIIDRLLEPVRPGDDPEQTREVLEGSRQALVDEALAMHQERERFNRQLCEYEAAHGFTPVVTRPSRIDEVRTRGRDLNTELKKGASDKGHTATSTVPKVIYSSPVKNLRAAAEVAKDLSSLSGEALREQQARLNHLLSEATKQQEAFKKANPGAGASQYVVSAGGAGVRSRGQASSPHPSVRRAGSVTSGRRDKQIQVYDPAITGKQAMVQKSAGQADKNVSSKKAGQNVPAGQGAASAGGGRSNSAARGQ
jgi:hypothetical protein